MGLYKAVNRVSECPNIQRADEYAEDVEEILNDAYRQLALFYNIIRSSALHVYHSALNFAPPGTRLYRTYSSKFPDKIVAGRVQKHWGPLVTVLTGLSEVEVVSFSPDGTRLVSGSGNGTVLLWDGTTGLIIAILVGHSRNVHVSSFSPDGSRLASGSFDNTVRLWDGTTGELVAILEGHSGYVAIISFSPDGSRLASGSTTP